MTITRIAVCTIRAAAQFPGGAWWVCPTCGRETHATVDNRVFIFSGEEGRG